MTTYRHTQIGWAVLIPILLVLAVAWRPITSAAGPPQTIALFVSGLLAVVALLFATLTVTVADGWLECRFGIGIIRRRVSLRSVQRADVVRNKWYYGWGIRLTPHGWLWNVAGLHAVELTFANGKKFRIGTDEPNRLLGALRGDALYGGALRPSG